MSENTESQKPADQSQALVHTPSAIGKCRQCGRETKEITECVVCQHERIMRAAPDLLESCRELVQAMRDYEMEVDGDKPEKHRRMMKRASAAIKKATSVV